MYLLQELKFDNEITKNPFKNILSITDNFKYYILIQYNFNELSNEIFDNFKFGGNVGLF